MRLKQILIGSLFVESLLTFAFAQTKTWTFEDEMCTYEGYYESKKYTEKELADTYELFRTNLYAHDGGTFEELVARYDSLVRAVENLEVVQVRYFQRFKKDVLRYLRETSELKKVQKKAKEDPEHLIAAVEEDSQARKYAEALQKGGDDLLDAYKYLIKQQMKNNSFPEYLWYNYETTMKRADRLDRAFDYVLVYGWWNDANHSINHIDYDGTQFKEFQQLFIKVDTLDCEEP